ncbi:hypothetical protein D3C81_1992140 [compost metagenome]
MGVFSLGVPPGAGGIRLCIAGLRRLIHCPGAAPYPVYGGAQAIFGKSVGG